MNLKPESYKYPPCRPTTASRRIRLTSVVICLLGTLIAGHSNAADVVLDEIVAIVNDGVVLQSDLEAEVFFLTLQAKSARQTIPPKAELDKLVLDRLVNREIQRQRANQAGIEVDQAAVNRAIEKVASGNNMNSFEFREQLQSQGFNYSHYRDSIAHEILLSRLVRREVQDSITVTEKEIDDFLANDANKPEEIVEYRIRHIIVAASENASTSQINEAKNKTDELIKLLQDGADFSSVAKRESDGSRASSGGDLGWRQSTELPDFISTQLGSLKKGDISDAIRSKDGFHIIQIEDRRSNLEQEIAEEIRLRHIFIAAESESDNNAARQTLTDLRTRIMAGESFATLANEFSQDPDSKGNGGELPWLGSGQMPLPMEQMSNEVSIGQISLPFKTQFGWHIIEVLERRTSDSPDSKLRNEASLVLKERKFEQEVERWQQRLRSESFVEIKN